MKKTIFKTAIVLSSFMVTCYLYTQKGNQGSKLSSSNIEALANGENYGDTLCIGSGSVDCAGEKVEYTIEDFRLD